MFTLSGRMRTAFHGQTSGNGYFADEALFGGSFFSDQIFAPPLNFQRTEFSHLSASSSSSGDSNLNEPEYAIQIGTDFVVTGNRWTHNVITWSFEQANYSNQQGKDFYAGFSPGSTERNLITQAINLWDNAATNLTFQQVADSADVDIRFGWGNNLPNDTGFNTLGVTWTFWSGTNTLTSGNDIYQTLTQALIMIDWADEYSDLPGGTSSDKPFLNVVLHEIGHAIGLGHYDVQTAIMNTLASNMTSLTSHEINGVNYLYPRPGTGTPDYTATITSISSASGSAGQTITVNYRISNIGQDGNGPSWKLYLSQDQTISPTNEVVDLNVGTGYVLVSMNGNTSTTGSTSFTVPSGISGTWYVGMVVDPGDYLDEANENNNVSSLYTFNVSGVANRAPTVTLPSGANVTASSAGQTFQLSSLFRGSDPDNNPLTYYLYDSNAAANSGRFVVNGTIVPAQTIYQVSASQLAQATFVAGAAGTADDILVQAFDGLAYSGWNAQVHVSVQSPNIAPTVSRPSGASVTASSAGQSIAFSSLFAGSDANGDPLTYFLYDSNAAASSGHWVVNGTTVAARTIYQVTASQLAQTSFVVGAAGTADDILVQAFDGRAYSGWNAQVHVSAPAVPNTAPTVSRPSGTNVTASNGQSFAFSSLFAGSDANGDPLTYFLYDSNAAASSGHWVVNGTIVAAQTIYQVAASQLAQTSFVAGAAGTADDILVQAFDGRAYSGWNSSVRVAVPAGPTDDYRDSLTDTSLPFGTVAVNGFRTGALEVVGDRDWFSVQLVGGRTYTISLLGSASGYGTLTDTYLRVHNSAGTQLAQDDDGAGNLQSQLAFTPGTSGTYYLDVGAYNDGLTGTYRVSVSAPSNRAPTVNLPSGASVSATAAQTLQVSSLFSGSDADGDALTYYLYDSSSAANSGRFVVNGTIVPAQTIYQVTASQMAQATFVAGAAGTADDILVQAYDGQAYSGWNAQVRVTVNTAPTISRPAGASVTASTAGQSLAFSSLFAGNDANGDPLTYFLYDSNAAANSGHWVVNGTILAAQTIHQVTASQLAQTSFVVGAAGTADDILAQAFDGKAYSGWSAQVHVSAPAVPNAVPTVSLPSGASVTASNGQSFAFSSLFAGNDADGDPLTYFLYDSSPAANSGHWVVNGTIVPAQTIHQVSATQLAQTTFVAGASGTSDVIYVQDFDGRAYSGWNAHVNVAVPANAAPTISLPSGTAVQATAAQSLAASGLFSGSDANGDTLTYFVYDSNAAANSGHFAINGATVPARTITQVTAAELAQTTFVAGAAGTTDYLYVEAFDGQVYSPWTEFHVFV